MNYDIGKYAFLELCYLWAFMLSCDILNFDIFKYDIIELWYL